MNPRTLAAALALALAASLAHAAPPPIFGAAPEPSRMTWTGAQGFNVTDHHAPARPMLERQIQLLPEHQHRRAIYLRIYIDQEREAPPPPTMPAPPLYCVNCYNH